MALEQKEQYCEEHRKHQRIEKNLTIRYGRLEDLGKDSLYSMEGELLDISAGGIRFLSEEAIAINTQLVIQIDFPGWQAEGSKWIATKQEDDVAHLDVVGMVVWMAVNEVNPDKFDVGVSFAGILS